MNKIKTILINFIIIISLLLDSRNAFSMDTFYGEIEYDNTRNISMCICKFNNSLSSTNEINTIDKWVPHIVSFAAGVITTFCIDCSNCKKGRICRCSKGTFKNCLLPCWKNYLNPYPTFDSDDLNHNNPNYTLCGKCCNPFPTYPLNDQNRDNPSYSPCGTCLTETNKCCINNICTPCGTCLTSTRTCFRNNVYTPCGTCLSTCSNRTIGSCVNCCNKCSKCCRNCYKVFDPSVNQDEKINDDQ